MSLISISICLSDLPKDKMKVAANGKIYMDLTCTNRREVGKYGDTHTVYVAQTKEEREAKAPIIYVGSGKEYQLKSNTQQPQSNSPQAPVQGASQDPTDDLPF